jgi:hypothetical protein
MRRNQQPIKRAAFAVFLALIASGALARIASAQAVLGNLLPNPRLFVVTPCGGKVGTTFEMTFSGLDLEEPQALLFSHKGIKATPIIPPTPPPPKPDPKKPAPPPPPKPPITKFSVTIDASTPPGTYDVRFVNKWGISNPRAFVVGELTEVAEKEPNDNDDKAQRVEINSTITGVIANPVDVDYYVFAGKKGQRVVVSCLASSIDSRLDPELKLYDSNQKQLASNQHYQGKDALLDCTLPADGDYYVRLCQFAHVLGGPEYFYRLSITTAPWIDLVYPPMVEPGKEAQLTVFGRNLPGGKLDPKAVLDGSVLEKITVKVTAPKDPAALHRLAYTGHIGPASSSLDGFEYRIRNGVGASNPFLITFAHAPVVVDNEANDTADTAQEIKVPCEIAGKIEKKGDRDWYVFNAKKGDVFWIELLSERLGAPTDLYLSLRNPATKSEIVPLDDTVDTLHPFRFYTGSRDPAPYRFVVPADGKYQLLVGSHLSDTYADVQQYYRIRITPDRSDFHLIVMPPDGYRPDACTLRQGGNQFFTVMAWRHDDFKGEITLSVEGLPEGVTCKPQVLGPNLKQTLLVVSAASNAAAWQGEIKVKGTATIKGKVEVREARPATITWPVIPQGNVQTAARLDRSLVLAVREKAPFNVVIGSDQVKITQGEKANVPLKLTRLWADFKTPLQIQPLPQDLPPGLTFAPVALAPDKTDANLVLTTNTLVPPGTYNIVLRSFGAIPFNKDPMAKQKPPLNVVQPSTPLALVVLPKQVATLVVANPNPTFKIGTPAEVVLRVNRQYDYAGEFKVQLVLPPNTQGVSADDTVIPAGKDEIKLAFKVPENATPGNRPNLTVRATAMWMGNVPVVHEVKINVNLVK